MGYINYSNTQAVGLKLKKDLNRIAFTIDLAMQIIFICFYTYSAIIKVGMVVHHIIYASYLLVGIAFLVYFLMVHRKNDKEEKKTRAKVRKIIRWCKYPIRTFLIIFSVVDVLSNGASDLTIILLAISVISFIVQIIWQISLKFLRMYVDLFSESLKMDYDESLLIKACYNKYKYGNKTVVKKKKASNMIMDKVINKVNEFVVENKDLAPEPNLTTKQLKIRSEINDLKYEYLPNYIEDGPLTIEESTEEEDEEVLEALEESNNAIVEANEETLEKPSFMDKLNSGKNKFASLFSKRKK